MGTLLSNNIKFLRKKVGFTQEQFAEKIGIKRSLVGAYEEGRAEPGVSNLQKISDVLEVSVDNLISQDYTNPEVEKKILRQDIEAKRLRVLSITVDKEDNEKIILVPQKASAGYLNGYSDIEFISELPAFQLPFFKNGTFRAFEVTGDSMLPIQPGTVIIGQYVDNWFNIKDGQTYIILSKSEGIVYKRAFNHIKTKGVVTLSSDNPLYSPFDLPMEDLLEAWEAKAFISTNFPQAEMSMQKLTSLVLDLQTELSRLKKD